MASVELEVHQPPIIKTKLKPFETMKVGRSMFSIFCYAGGKPRPMVRWLKDDKELMADANMYEVRLLMISHGQPTSNQQNF